jgi:hypothetical protein
MSKESFYFSHDYNARTDRKLVNVIIKHGMSGIGVYWCLVEMLYEEGGYIPLEYERIAFELRTDEKLIQNIICNFELFKVDDMKFWSESVIERLEKRCEKSETARQSVLKRWDKYKCNTDVIQSNNNSNTIKESKVKEINITFETFWNLYNKKVGAKSKCENKWNKLKDEERQKIIDTLPKFKASIKDIQFQPFPETYLNQERWNDEIKVVKLEYGTPGWKAENVR